MMLPASLLIKPVSASCNLECRYCFYLGKSRLYPDRPRCMDYEVLRSMVSQFMDICSTHAAFSWQGGEPLLAGLEFYRRAVEAQEEFGRGHIVSNAFQTNGTLLNPEWAEFFNSYKFLVGISIDGPPELHNIYRRTRNSKPTFDMVMDGVSLLREGGVEFNALCVVNDVNVHHPEKIYDFFSEEGIKFLQFVPCLEWDDERDAPALENVEPGDYGRFLCLLFDRWARDYPEVYIRLFNSILAMRLGQPPGLCTMGPSCGEYVVIEHNGDVYPCDFFVRPEMRLGNIMETPLRRMVEGSALLEFARCKSRLPPECGDCEWLDLCFGGCQYHRWPDASGRTRFCSAYKRFFEHSEPGFRAIERSL